MNPPRLAYVCADPGVPVFGQKGCSVHVQEVLRALRRQGVSVELFAARLGGEPPDGLESVPVHRLPRPAGESLAVREEACWQANGPLADRLNACGPFDAVYERHSLWSVAGLEHARQQGIPGLLEVNAPLVDEQATHRGLVNRDRAESVSDSLFRSATRVLAVSDAVARHVAGRVPESRVTVIANGVDPDRIHPEVPPALPGLAPSFTVGFAGTLKPWHGMSVMVDALALLRRQVPGARLLVVGDGPEREALGRQALRLGLSDAIHFRGAVPPADIPALLTSMDAAVAPYPESSAFYFSPLKLYEYMAAGRAVVASRLGEIPGCVEHGKTGLLCRPGCPEDLARFLQILHRFPAFRQRLGAAARQRVLTRHTWDGVARRILDIAGFGAAAGPEVPGVGEPAMTEVAS